MKEPPGLIVREKLASGDETYHPDGVIWKVKTPANCKRMNSNNSPPGEDPTLSDEDAILEFSVTVADYQDGKETYNFQIDVNFIQLRTCASRATISLTTPDFSLPSRL